MAKPYLVLKILGDLITADHKVLEQQLRVSKQSSICSRGAGSSHSMDPGGSRAKKQNFTRNPERACKSSWSPRGNTKVIYTDNSFGIRKSLWRSFMESLHVLHHTDQETNGIAERAVRRVKEGTSAVLLQSGLNEVGGQILWNVTPICETSQTCCLMGRRPMKDVLWEAIWRTYYSFWFTSWVSPYNCEGSVANPSIWKESIYLDCSSDTLSTRGEFGRVTYWSQTLRSWKRWTHRKSTRKDSMRKRWYFPNKENLFFQSQMDESKLPEQIRNWEHPPWYGIDQFKERVTLTFLENQKGLFHNLTTPFPDAGEAINDYWSMSGKLHIPPITLNPESNFTRREKNHSLFH